MNLSLCLPRLLLTAASSSSSSSSASTAWFSGIVRGRSDKFGSVKMANIPAGGGENAGPIKAKNQFRGVLFKYGPKPIQI